MTRNTLLQTPPPQPLLTTLLQKAAKRSNGPPRYSQLHHSAAHQKGRADFEFMVKNELPEFQDQILADPSLSRTATSLYNIIESNFFPLDDSSFDPDEYADPPESWYQTILQGIPWMPVGRSWDDLHDLWDSEPPGMIHTALLISANSGDFFDEGLRTTWFDSVSETIESDLARILWNATWTVGHTIRTLDNSEHADVAHTLRYITNWDENPFLDSLQAATENNLHTEPWTRPIIEAFAADWTEARVSLDHLDSASKKMETHPNTTLRQIVDLLTKTEEP